MQEDVLQREEHFHDEWAHSVDPASVKVDELQTACTMPETRYIISRLGDVRGKKVLELGCGCGEASVYFAKHGAEVTSTDLSQGMVDLTQRVAAYHGAKLEGVVCSADKLPFEDNSFDIAYAANVLHHVDMQSTLREIKRVLKRDGVLVSWDPVKYNPAIQVYRRMAAGVRTTDEHPLTVNDLKTVQKEFDTVESRGFWLLTNLVFIRYYFIEKLDPGKVRYWKRIIDDADRLKDFYLPLEKADDLILKAFPFLKWLCWNMVLIAGNKRNRIAEK